MAESERMMAEDVRAGNNSEKEKSQMQRRAAKAGKRGIKVSKLPSQKQRSRQEISDADNFGGRAEESRGVERRGKRREVVREQIVGQKCRT